MNDIFIASIEVKKVRNIENFIISLSETERKHLIITGKNGSGKTSLLLEINKFIRQILISKPNEYLIAIDAIKRKYGIIISNNVADHFKLVISKYGGTEILFKNTNDIYKNYLAVFFGIKRPFDLINPKGINKVELKDKYLTEEKVNQNFIQYIVNLKAERSFANDDNDNESVEKIDAWFLKFENQLKELFDAPDLQLIFDRQNYNFHIQIGDNETFTLAQLSDGYSAVLSIVTELILRMEATGNKAHDLQGVVLIDEIETHLHVALQKKIMPFFMCFFSQYPVYCYHPFPVRFIFYQ